MNTKSKFTAMLYCLSAFYVGYSAAQDQDGFNNPLEGVGRRECLADSFECFQLFNRCEPIDAVIQVQENQIGLTEDRVRTTVESRLRAARLYESESGPYLYVVVNIMSEEEYAVPFSFSLYFYKWLFDELTDNTRLAGNWDIGRFGAADDAGFVLQSISELMDRFINDYLRVNEAACD